MAGECTAVATPAHPGSGDARWCKADPSGGVLHAAFVRPCPSALGSMPGTLVALLRTRGGQVSNISYLFVLRKYLEPPRTSRSAVDSCIFARSNALVSWFGVIRRLVCHYQLEPVDGALPRSSVELSTALCHAGVVESFAETSLLVVSAGTGRSLLGSHIALWLFLRVYTVPGRSKVPQPAELPRFGNMDLKTRKGYSASTLNTALGMQAAPGCLHISETSLWRLTLSHVFRCLMYGHCT